MFCLVVSSSTQEPPDWEQVPEQKLVHVVTINYALFEQKKLEKFCLQALKLFLFVHLKSYFVFF